MVKLRLVSGGKENNPSPAARLFSAWSVVDNFHGYDRVRINWVYPDRKNPVADYEDLIDEYARIDKRMRGYFEEYVSELFTEEEIELLKPRVSALLGTELNVVEETVPVSCVFVPMPQLGMKQGAHRGLFDPSDAVQWDLPFSAHGCYDLSRCPPSIAIQPSEMENGTAFLSEALSVLNIDLQGLDLRRAVASVYDSSGLFVGKGRNLGQRLEEFGRFNNPKAANPK